MQVQVLSPAIVTTQRVTANRRTLFSCTNKCDLPRAEAVLAVIESRNDQELQYALSQTDDSAKTVERTTNTSAFRVALVGVPNAGKRTLYSRDDARLPRASTENR